MASTDAEVSGVALVSLARSSRSWSNEDPNQSPSRSPHASGNAQWPPDKAVSRALSYLHYLRAPSRVSTTREVGLGRFASWNITLVERVHGSEYFCETRFQASESP